MTSTMIYRRNGRIIRPVNSLGIERTRRITKRQFYALGAFANSSLYRKDRGRGWQYYMLID